MSDSPTRPFRCAVLTPSYGNTKIQFTHSLAKMILYFSQVRIYEECDEQAIDFFSAEGAGISSNREKLLRDAMAKDFTHCLFIDEDTGFDSDALHVLAAKRQPVVGGNYKMRVPGGDFAALNKDGTARVQTTAESTGLEECEYMGFGFCLIAREVIEAFGDAPMFMLGYIPEKVGYTTEDWYFFQKVREFGFTPYIDQDCSKKLVHMGGFGYSWRDNWGAL